MFIIIILRGTCLYLNQVYFHISKHQVLFGKNNTVHISCTVHQILATQREILHIQGYIYK